MSTLKDVPVEWKALGEIANFRRGSYRVLIPPKKYKPNFR